jgi:hypothetical protein
MKAKSKRPRVGKRVRKSWMQARSVSKPEPEVTGRRGMIRDAMIVVNNDHRHDHDRQDHDQHDHYRRDDRRLDHDRQDRHGSAKGDRSPASVLDLA